MKVLLAKSNTCLLVMNSKHTQKTLLISEAQELSNSILKKWGFSLSEAKWITHNIIAAEMANKKTHGLTRIQFINQFLLSKVNISGTKELISEGTSHLYFDAKFKLGFEPIYDAMEQAFQKLKSSAIVAIGIKDCLFSGYVGDYAHYATLKGLIYMGFHNSVAALIPHGAAEPLWGTNPITIGIPSAGFPVIYDAAMSQISGGQVLLNQKKGIDLPNDVAMDKDGQITRDPFESVGLLSHGHKGSGLAYVVELLAGALTASRVGNSVQGGWGSYSILINPTMFRSLADFQADVKTSQDELKHAKKATGVKEIFFPGEQSARSRQINKKNRSISIPMPVYEELLQFNQ